MQRRGLSSRQRETPALIELLPPIRVLLVSSYSLLNVLCFTIPPFGAHTRASAPGLLVCIRASVSTEGNTGAALGPWLVGVQQPGLSSRQRETPALIELLPPIRVLLVSSYGLLNVLCFTIPPFGAHTRPSAPGLFEQRRGLSSRQRITPALMRPSVPGW